MENEKKKISKKVIWIIAAVAVIVIAAGVSAAMLLTKNDKQAYFSAEMNSLNFMKDEVEERYGDELDWMEQTKEKPSETTVELSANYNDPSGFDSTGFQQIINNASVTLVNSYDPENKKMMVDAKASAAGISLEDIKFYLSEDEMMVSLPFLEKVLQVKEDELGNLLTTLDPSATTGLEDIEFDQFFNQNVMSDEDIEHFREAYLQMIYDELPKGAFTSEEETVEVNGASVKATKLTMHLSEKQLKGIIEKVITTAQNDDVLKEYIEEQASLEQFAYNASEVDQLLTDFDTALTEMKDGLSDFQIPNGLTSTLWTKDNLIVKRDMSIEMAPADEELVAFTVTGTQQLEDKNQTFNYQLGFDDGVEAQSLAIKGDLSWKDQQADDKITVSAGDMELSYTGTEQMNDGTREFDRQFGMNDGMQNFRLNWTGDSTYEQDQMNAQHNFSVSAEGITEDMFELQLNNEAKLVKSVDFDAGSKEILNLGSMSETELQNYFMQEATPQFQQWMMKFYMGGF
ncbi:DUF6583 family protein [Paraliobacillus ryukyuensis]|uniref:DUF6583 family protein n=1 Tax=Paraliobacillus ryukyuensis TaxID=200904 RepID=UPI0009A8207A|nr:DUF6583 family protein [Paraliobacillus ryukyuensis]